MWLDLPLALKLVRVAARTVRRIRSDEELWHANRETWRGGFWGAESVFFWTVRTHFLHRRVASRLLAGRRVVRLRSPQEVAEFVDRTGSRTIADLGLTRRSGQ